LFTSGGLGLGLSLENLVLLTSLEDEWKWQWKCSLSSVQQCLCRVEVLKSSSRLVVRYTWMVAAVCPSVWSARRLTRLRASCNTVPSATAAAACCGAERRQQLITPRAAWTGHHTRSSSSFSAGSSAVSSSPAPGGARWQWVSSERCLLDAVAADCSILPSTINTAVHQCPPAVLDIYCRSAVLIALLCPASRVGALSDDARLTSVWRLTSVCLSRTSDLGRKQSGLD